MYQLRTHERHQSVWRTHNDTRRNTEQKFEILSHDNDIEISIKIYFGLQTINAWSVEHGTDWLWQQQATLHWVINADGDVYMCYTDTQFPSRIHRVCIYRFSQYYYYFMIMSVLCASTAAIINKISWTKKVTYFVLVQTICAAAAATTTTVAVAHTSESRRFD